MTFSLSRLYAKVPIVPIAIGAALVGAAALAFAPAAGGRGGGSLPRLPETQRLRWEIGEDGIPRAIVDGQPLTWIPPGEQLRGASAMRPSEYDHLAPRYVERHRYVRGVLNKWWTANRLRARVTSHWMTDDGRSQVAYLFPAWTFLPFPEVHLYELLAYGSPRTLDEFRRGLKSEQSGGGGGFDPVGGLAGSFGNLMKNPLFRAALSIAVVAFGGPAGVAVYGAYNAWQARGKEWSLQEVALVSARAYAVSQCGEACGVAFDFGVGVASGDSVDESAERALTARMSPAERAAYDDARAAYRKVRT